MYLPLQIVDEEDIAQADSLFRAGLETRVQRFSHMTWADRLHLIGNNLWHVVLCRKQETNNILRAVKHLDPDAFVSVGSVMGVYGKGFEDFDIKTKKNLKI